MGTISFCAARRASSTRSWRSSSRIRSVVSDSRTSPSGERPRRRCPSRSRAPSPGRCRRRAEVVRGAGGDRAEHDLLGDPPAEQHGHVVDQLLAGLQVAVLGGQVQGVAERPPAGHDRDAVDAVHRRQQLAAERVAGLVEGHDVLLVHVQHALRLHAGDHPLDGRVEVARRRSCACAGPRRSRPRCRCWPGPPPPARWSAGRRGRGRRPREACCGCAPGALPGGP